MSIRSKQHQCGVKPITVKRWAIQRHLPRQMAAGTTKPEPGHKIYPYLLRGVQVTQPNQVWAMDITYIPMERGFVYLAVVLDWFSRRVLSWSVSITMEAAFCVETPEDALSRHGRPDIFNTDQGSQFPGAAFTGVLIKNGIAISMDGKGAWRDNVFVEWLWRSSDAASNSTIGAGRSRALTARPPITPTSPHCLSPWQPSPGRRSTCRRGNAVQTTGTTSLSLPTTGRPA